MSSSTGTSQRPAGADAAFRDLLDRVVRLGATYTSGPASHNASRPIHELPHGALEFSHLPSRLVGCSEPGAWISPGLAAARFLYLLTGRRDIRFFEPYSGGVRKFSADGTSLGGSAYGARLFGTRPGEDQVRQCVTMIRDRPNTKRAAAALFQPYTADEPAVDVACCLGIAFMPRASILDTSVIMRANDAIRLLPYNLFEFSMLAEMVARLTGTEPGTYRHLAVSMHLRGEHDIRLAADLLASPAGGSVTDMGSMPELTWDTVGAMAGLGSELSEALHQPPGTCEDAVTQVVTRSLAVAGPYWHDIIAAAAARGLARRTLLPQHETAAREWGGSRGPLLDAELALQRRASAVVTGSGGSAPGRGTSRPGWSPGRAGP
jgi:Thymidylate synthase